MLTIWKHFLADRRKGMLPALIAFAILQLTILVSNTMRTPWLLAIGVIFFVFAWVFAVPSMIYLMDRPVKKPPQVPRELLN